MFKTMLHYLTFEINVSFTVIFPKSRKPSQYNCWQIMQAFLTITLQKLCKFFKKKIFNQKSTKQPLLRFHQKLIVKRLAWTVRNIFIFFCFVLLWIYKIL